MNPAWLGVIVSFTLCFVMIGLSNKLAVKRVLWKKTLMHSMLCTVITQLLIRILQIATR